MRSDFYLGVMSKHCLALALRESVALVMAIVLVLTQHHRFQSPSRILLSVFELYPKVSLSLVERI